jgi:hydrogenase maturation factor
MLFDPGISIVAAANAIRSVTRPAALHDPTEGGLATALHELAAAIHLTLRIEPDAVRVFDATASVCNALSLDPWGLLASGALLAVVAEADAVTAIEAAQRAGIACGRIGTTENGPARVIMGAGETQLLRTFPRDELARFYDEQGS